MSLTDIVQLDKRLLTTLDVIAHTQSITEHDIQRMYTDTIVRGIIWYQVKLPEDRVKYQNIYEEQKEYHKNATRPKTS